MKRLLLISAFSLAVMSSALLFLGCEAESSADVELDLTPRRVTLKYLQSARFKVSGGFEYRWSLSDETLGELSNRSGDEVGYINLSTNVGTQTITVRSFIIGASGNNPTNIVNTNGIQSITSASAIIIQAGK